MHVHLVLEPTAEALAVLRESLSQGITLSMGEAADPATEMLVTGRPTPEQLGHCPRLRALVIPFAGVPPATLELMRLHPQIGVYNLHHNAPATAEMAVALLLAAAKTICPADAKLRVGDWGARFDHDRAVQLAGRNALVLGLGAIGRRVAHACRGLGMSVQGISARGHAVDGIEAYPPDALHRLLPGADALFVCLPATSATQGMLGVHEIALLPRNCVLVNIARGSVIDEAALYEALLQRRIFAAGLDVWWQYPKAGEHASSPSRFPFHELANVVMSPHRGGHVQDTEPQRMRALAELLNAALAGGPPPNRVSLESGY